MMAVAALAATLVISSLTVNRLVQRKLRLSLVLFAGYILFNLVVWQRPVSCRLDGDLRALERLVFAAAAINLLVYALVNPLRSDRVPDAFPSILQDAMVIGLLVLIATFVFEDKLLTTSAVGAVVVGFALQDTLGNAFAGLGIQSEKPFRVGHWIRVGDFEGRVAEVTWRATKLRTKAGNFVIVPNNIIAKDAITNYSEPAVPTRLEVEVGASYLSTPADVKAAALEALGQVPRVLDHAAARRAAALVRRLGHHLPHPLLDRRLRARRRGARRGADGHLLRLRRRGIEIPWPIEVGYSRDWPEPDAATKQQERERVLARVDLFSRLTTTSAATSPRRRRSGSIGAGRGHRAAERSRAVDVHRLLGLGGGAARTRSARRWRSIEAGGYFGEMSLLTGDARSASVVARGDTSVLELDAELFRALGAADPESGRGDRPGRGDAPRAAGSDTRVDPERRRGRCPGDVSGSDEEVSAAGVVQLPLQMSLDQWRPAP